MNAHTRGPWKAVTAAVCAEIEMMEIAEVSHMRVVPAAGVWPNPGTPEADAFLIAAAPDLLAALRNLDHACRLADAYEELSGHVDGSLLDAAHAAIAKATGEPQ